jgi:rubrerythrin
MDIDYTALEAIGLAIKSEEDAVEFYQKVAGLVKNDLVRAKYTSLASEEMGHRLILVNLYKKMTGEKTEPPKITSKIETAEGGFPMVLEKFDDILNYAIAREQEAQAFYKRAASQTSDISGKRTFEYLADIERGHELTLKAELDAYKRDKNWYSDNPDIQLVGP